MDGITMLHLSYISLSFVQIKLLSAGVQDENRKCVEWLQGD